MKYLLLLLIFATSGTVLSEQYDEETDTIYWETPAYLSKLRNEEIQYVYHQIPDEHFIGNWIVPLNMMPSLEGFSEIYKYAISKYQGRESLLSRIIPTLNCLWNDVLFLSPIHPNKQYEEYKKIGYAINKRRFYKIPIAILKEKRVSVWKWLSFKKYSKDDPIHQSMESYCVLDIANYQEMDAVPQDTKEHYKQRFDSENPGKYTALFYYRIPHILCQDPIDIRDERITIIDWEDPID